MQIRSVLPCATWYHAYECGTHVGDCNDETSYTRDLGYFATPIEAQNACRRAGLKILDEKARKGDDGGRVMPVLVVFTTKSRTKGTVVSGDPIELTAAVEGRRQQILRRAKRAGIPAHAINLTAIA